jgi:hypothetical protein
VFAQPAQARLRSVHSKQAAVITFRNASARPVRALWVDFDGNEVRAARERVAGLHAGAGPHAGVGWGTGHVLRPHGRMRRTCMRPWRRPHRPALMPACVAPPAARRSPTPWWSPAPRASTAREPPVGWGGGGGLRGRQARMGPLPPPAAAAWPCARRAQLSSHPPAPHIPPPSPSRPPCPPCSYVSHPWIVRELTTGARMLLSGAAAVVGMQEEQTVDIADPPALEWGVSAAGAFRGLHACFASDRMAACCLGACAAPRMRCTPHALHPACAAPRMRCPCLTPCTPSPHPLPLHQLDTHCCFPEGFKTAARQLLLAHHRLANAAAREPATPSTALAAASPMAFASTATPPCSPMHATTTTTHVQLSMPQTQLRIAITTDDCSPTAGAAVSGVGCCGAAPGSGVASPLSPRRTINITVNARGSSLGVNIESHTLPPLAEGKAAPPFSRALPPPPASPVPQSPSGRGRRALLRLVCLRASNCVPGAPEHSLLPSCVLLKPLPFPNHHLIHTPFLPSLPPAARCAAASRAWSARAARRRRAARRQPRRCWAAPLTSRFAWRAWT